MFAFLKTNVWRRQEHESVHFWTMLYTASKWCDENSGSGSQQASWSSSTSTASRGTGTTSSNSSDGDGSTHGGSGRGSSKNSTTSPDCFLDNRISGIIAMRIFSFWQNEDILRGSLSPPSSTSRCMRSQYFQFIILFYWMFAFRIFSWLVLTSSGTSCFSCEARV